MIRTVLATKAHPVKSVVAPKIVLRSLTSSFPTMGWQEEKERRLNLTTEQWKKRLDDMNAKLLADITPWKLFFGIKRQELEKQMTDAARLKFAEEHGDLDLSHDFSDRVSIFQGDITQLGIDCIVNAANKYLLGGGGVDGAIHRAAGNLLKKECETLNGCNPGDAKITSGYDLPARYVIHTVGPQGPQPDVLSSCYKKSLQLMMENKQRSIAFPCISTGVYGYPSELACPVALRAVREFLNDHHDKVDRVIFCLFMEKDIKVYSQQMQLFFPVLTENNLRQSTSSLNASTPDASSTLVEPPASTASTGTPETKVKVFKPDNSNANNDDSPKKVA